MLKYPIKTQFLISKETKMTSNIMGLQARKLWWKLKTMMTKEKGKQ